jgi:hypothetical protein
MLSCLALIEHSFGEQYQQQRCDCDIIFCASNTSPWSFASRACPAVLAAALIIRIDLVIPGGTFLKKKAGCESCDLILNAEVSLIGNNKARYRVQNFLVSFV